MAGEFSTGPIDAHYTVEVLDEKILQALKASGKDLDVLTVEDLAPVDNFHMGGLDATRRLLELADPAPDQQILDVGGGLGGPARLLATETGATVTVLDATKEYCRAGERITELLGLENKVRFRQADARDMPFEDQSFDLAWLQHTTMNIDDKQALFKELHRVLRPGGRVIMHEVLAGGAPLMHFPVPWAQEQSMSFLASPSEFMAALSDNGFSEVVWNDVTLESLGWWQQRLAAAAEQEAPPPLGIHLLMGPDTPEKANNVLRALEDEMLVVVQAVFQRD